jgi:transposase
MRRMNFSEEDLATIREQRFCHAHPHIQKKLEVLWLKSKGVIHIEIARLTGLGRRTIQRYLAEFRSGGLAATLEVRFAKPQSELVDHADLLAEHFAEHPPRSIRDAQADIERLTGIRRGLTQVREFLKKKIGLKWLKVGALPHEPDTSEQSRFLQEELLPRLEEAKQGKREVWFMDASHFVYAAFLGFLWCAVRLFIPSPTGRKRCNVLGAVNAITREVRWVSNTGSVNENTVVDLLKQLAHSTDGPPVAGVPITVVLDNARYQKTWLVRIVAEWCGIELLHLPAYSPNLNLIERLWKFVKKEALRSRCLGTFADFQAAIERCLADTATKHKDQLESLLTLNFQLFDDVSILAA